MSHPYSVVVLTVLVAIVVIALSLFAIEAGDELTQNQPRVVCTAMEV